MLKQKIFSCSNKWKDYLLKQMAMYKLEIDKNSNLSYKQINNAYSWFVMQSERLENIEQQFVAAPPNHLRYRKVLIVDDVVTTGSSITALSQVLQQLGCQQVYSICLAAPIRNNASSLNFADTMESPLL